MSLPPEIVVQSIPLLFLAWTAALRLESLMLLTLEVDEAVAAWEQKRQ